MIYQFIINFKSQREMAEYFNCNLSEINAWMQKGVKPARIKDKIVSIKKFDNIKDPTYIKNHLGDYTEMDIYNNFRNDKQLREELIKAKREYENNK